MLRSRPPSSAVTTIFGSSRIMSARLPSARLPPPSLPACGGQRSPAGGELVGPGEPRRSPRSNLGRDDLVPESEYSFWYCGQTFSCAIFRKASTSAALTVIPLGSSSSFAFSTVSTVSVWPDFLRRAREVKHQLLLGRRQAVPDSRLITSAVGP